MLRGGGGVPLDLKEGVRFELRQKRIQRPLYKEASTSMSMRQEHLQHDLSASVTHLDW